MGSRENAVGLEGVELGAEGKTVSYSELLYSTYVFCGPVSNTALRPRPPYSPGRVRGGVQFHTKRGIKAQEFVDYDPNLLDDPQWPCGKHKRVLVFQSYMTTVIEYVKPSDLKRDMNETFGEKFPHVRLTLSKIRSLKREIRKLAQEDCGYEEPTVAMAFVYFEKLALLSKINKQNRRLCAGACILLAAKIGSDLKRPEVKNLIDRLEEKLRLNRKELLAIEFPVFVALEFELHLPHHVIQPHYRRLLLNS
ncbi:CDK5 and ABL1 enzyme substrate 1 [Astyanax mexicanus]|uniref:CDK5 and ABL1 enzyme substrate 1 n=1 Tax=Astyanax mexicanus TaxID=7994 RepID=UPI000BBE00BF|nr:CDK5 and ABL1 enzyme substrate 1 [Astyanax mexicanus]